MKNRITIYAAILMAAGTLFPQLSNAQAPQKMSYQAVIRDGSNQLVASSSVGIQISVLKDSENGTAVFVETHTPITNANGLVSLAIGNGTAVTGTFANIDWANGPYFIKTETDPTGAANYTISGTSELMSVPYALFSANQGGVVSAGDNITIIGTGTPANPYVISATPAPATYTLGLNEELGGYVFYVTPDGKHGLVAATQNQSEDTDWYEAQDNINNPDTHSEAGQNFTDWRLPTRSELIEMYYNRIEIGGFTIGAYFSSTEADNESAWYVAFWNGSMGTDPKSSVGWMIRAVRSF